MRRIGLTSCPYCGSSRVRPSRNTMLWERLSILLLLRLSRCHACMHHCYQPLLSVQGRPARKLQNTSPPSPATASQSPADVYVCQKCGSDITKYLNRGQAHTWEPIGSEHYLCPCGEKYPTGAIEWDHLGQSEKKRRLERILGRGIVFSSLFSVFGVVAYFVLDRSNEALIGLLAIAVIPFLLTNVTFWLEVAASIWRVRFRSSVTSERN
jgi:hypothetical protein